MTIDEFLDRIDKKQPPAPEAALAGFESTIGGRLPNEYRDFLVACNGGYLGGSLWYQGENPQGEVVEAGVHHIGGFRDESYFSLVDAYQTYKGRIPRSVIWIHDDPFGNAICIGVAGEARGKIYFWDHEDEPFEGEWDGEIDTANNVTILSNSFSEYVAGLAELDDG